MASPDDRKTIVHDPPPVPLPQHKRLPAAEERKHIFDSVVKGTWAPHLKNSVRELVIPVPDSVFASVANIPSLNQTDWWITVDRISPEGHRRIYLSYGPQKADPRIPWRMLLRHIITPESSTAKSIIAVVDIPSDVVNHKVDNVGFQKGNTNLWIRSLGRSAQTSISVLKFNDVEFDQPIFTVVANLGFRGVMVHLPGLQHTGPELTKLTELAERLSREVQPGMVQLIDHRVPFFESDEEPAEWTWPTTMKAFGKSWPSTPQEAMNWDGKPARRSADSEADEPEAEPAVTVSTEEERLEVVTATKEPAAALSSSEASSSEERSEEPEESGADAVDAAVPPPVERTASEPPPESDAEAVDTAPAPPDEPMEEDDDEEARSSLSEEPEESGADAVDAAVPPSVERTASEPPPESDAEAVDTAPAPPDEPMEEDDDEEAEDVRYSGLDAKLMYPCPDEGPLQGTGFQDLGRYRPPVLLVRPSEAPAPDVADESKGKGKGKGKSKAKETTGPGDYTALYIPWSKRLFEWASFHVHDCCASRLNYLESENSFVQKVSLGSNKPMPIRFMENIVHCQELAGVEQKSLTEELILSILRRGVSPDKWLSAQLLVVGSIEVSSSKAINDLVDHNPNFSVEEFDELVEDLVGQGVRFLLLSGKHSTAAAKRALHATPPHMRDETLKRLQHRQVVLWDHSKLGEGDIMAIVGGFNMSERKQQTQLQNDCELPRRLLHVARDMWMKMGRPARPTLGSTSDEWMAFQMATLGMSNSLGLIEVDAAKLNDSRGNWSWLWTLTLIPEKENTETPGFADVLKVLDLGADHAYANNDSYLLTKNTLKEKVGGRHATIDRVALWFRQIRIFETAKSRGEAPTFWLFPTMPKTLYSHANETPSFPNMTRKQIKDAVSGVKREHQVATEEVLLGVKNNEDWNELPMKTILSGLSTAHKLADAMDLLAAVLSPKLSEEIAATGRAETEREFGAMMTLEECLLSDFKSIGTASWAAWNPYKMAFIKEHHAALGKFVESCLKAGGEGKAITNLAKQLVAMNTAGVGKYKKARKAFLDTYNDILAKAQFRPKAAVVQVLPPLADLLDLAVSDASALNIVYDQTHTLTSAPAPLPPFFQGLGSFKTHLYPLIPKEVRDFLLEEFNTFVKGGRHEDDWWEKVKNMPELSVNGRWSYVVPLAKKMYGYAVDTWSGDVRPSTRVVVAKTDIITSVRTDAFEKLFSALVGKSEISVVIMDPPTAKEGTLDKWEVPGSDFINKAYTAVANVLGKDRVWVFITFLPRGSLGVSNPKTKDLMVWDTEDVPEGHTCRMQITWHKDGQSFTGKGSSVSEVIDDLGVLHFHGPRKSMHPHLLLKPARLAEDKWMRRPPSNVYFNPQQRSVHLMYSLIHKFSWKGSNIVSLFCGTGTDLEAACRVGVGSFGMDKFDSQIEACELRLSRQQAATQQRVAKLLAESVPNPSKRAQPETAEAEAPAPKKKKSAAAPAAASVPASAASAPPGEPAQKKKGKAAPASAPAAAPAPPGTSKVAAAVEPKKHKSSKGSGSHAIVETVSTGGQPPQPASAPGGQSSAAATEAAPGAQSAPATAGATAPKPKKKKKKKIDVD